jgi:CBS domain-containing protein
MNQISYNASLCITYFGLFVADNILNKTTRESKMLAKECMTKSVALGKPSMTILEAAQKMRDGNFGILPIEENDRLVGMITDRDIAVRGVAEGKDPKQAKVRDIMSSKVLYCYEDQNLDEIAENLGDNQVRRLPVLNRQKKLVGILSLSDIAKSHLDPEKLGSTLNKLAGSKQSYTETRIHH